MLTSVVSLDQMRSRSSWKVEFYCGGAVDALQTVYDALPFEALVYERRESINPQNHLSDPYSYLGLENVQSDTGDLVDFAPKVGKEIRSTCKVFMSGDILYGRLRPYLNKVYVAQGAVASGICSGEFYVLVPRKNRILPHVLRAMLASEYVQRQVTKWQTGSALPRLQLKDLLSIEVPVPPLEAQQVLEKYLLEMTNLRRKLTSLVDQLPQWTHETLMQSLQAGDPPVPRREAELLLNSLGDARN